MFGCLVLHMSSVDVLVSDFTEAVRETTSVLEAEKQEELLSPDSLTVGSKRIYELDKTPRVVSTKSQDFSSPSSFRPEAAADQR